MTPFPSPGEGRGSPDTPCRDSVNCSAPARASGCILPGIFPGKISTDSLSPACTHAGKSRDVLTVSNILLTYAPGGDIIWVINILLTMTGGGGEDEEDTDI